MQRFALVSMLAIASSCAAASQELRQAEPEARIARQQFELIKSLAGEWTGKGGESDPVEVNYRVTGAGSAVEEVLFPGTPHEMVTMYHLDNGRLMLTHYCSAGNQPRMVAEPATSLDPDCPEIHFTFVDGTNLTSANDGHMHEMLITIVDKDQFSSRWTFYKEGQPAEQAKFELTRKAVSVTG